MTDIPLIASEWDICLARGREGERALADLLGEDARIEVKRDSKAVVTGNVFIEYLYGDQPSGIATSEASWWAFVLDDSLGRISRMLLVPTARLKTAIAVNQWPTAVGGDRNGVTRGYLVPISELVKPL